MECHKLCHRFALEKNEFLERCINFILSCFFSLVEWLRRNDFHEVVGEKLDDSKVFCCHLRQLKFDMLQNYK